MNYKNILTQIIVGATLLGFIIASVYVFFNACIVNNKPDIDNNALVYVLSSLTGLVGGFVAASFGVEYNSSDKKENEKARKLMKIGSYATSDSDKQELIGFIFALSYILIGLTSVVIWVVLNDKAISSISKMATTFLGMSIPIVANFLKSNDSK